MPQPAQPVPVQPVPAQPAPVQPAQVQPAPAAADGNSEESALEVLDSDDELVQDMTLSCLVMGTFSTIFTINSESGPLVFNSVNKAVLTAWLLKAVLIFLLIKASLKVRSSLLVDIFYK